jgi:hypothetical protein
VSESWEIVVERGKIREFAEAMQSTSSSFRGPDAIAPPTFLITAASWAPRGARVELGFDRKRVLHGEQEFVYHGPPPRAGTVLHASERLADSYEKTGARGGTMRFAVVVTEFRDDAGTLVAEAICTVIERPALVDGAT